MRIVSQWKICMEQDWTTASLTKNSTALHCHQRTFLSQCSSRNRLIQSIGTNFWTSCTVKIFLFQQELRMGELALSCMCDLLVAHPYFNFSHNLVQMLVPYLNHSLPSVRQLCANSICTVFRNDKRGEISLEVRILRVRMNEF
jgi:hypothetical protein